MHIGAVDANRVVQIGVVVGAQRGQSLQVVTQHFGGTAIALFDPAIAKAFPNSEAVNEALLGLLMFTEQTARISVIQG